MASKARKRVKGKRRGRKPDAVSVQLSVTLLRKLKKGYKLSPKVLEQAVRRKAELSNGYWDESRGRVISAREGPDPTGMVLKIVRWRNPSRGRGKSGWRSGTQADAWGSLRGLLSAAKIQFTTVG